MILWGVPEFNISNIKGQCYLEVGEWRGPEKGCKTFLATVSINPIEYFRNVDQLFRGREKERQNWVHNNNNKHLLQRHTRRRRSFGPRVVGG